MPKDFKIGKELKLRPFDEIENILRENGLNKSDYYILDKMKKIIVKRVKGRIEVRDNIYSWPKEAFI